MRINVSGGKVYAIGALAGTAPGIGCSLTYTISGTIELTGGEIFVSRGGTDSEDIEKALPNIADIWTLEIGGTAALFMKSNTFTSPETTTHVHYTYPMATSSVYRVDFPAGWTDSFGAFLSLPNLSYNSNGDGGSAPVSVTQLAGSTVQISEGSGMSRTNCTFVGGNIAADGTGTVYRL